MHTLLAPLAVSVSYQSCILMLHMSRSDRLVRLCGHFRSRGGIVLATPVQRCYCVVLLDKIRIPRVYNLHSNPNWPD